MPSIERPSDGTLIETIKACVSNAERLEAESYDLEFREPPALQLYVLLIAQEEFGKAFLLLLIKANFVPFNRPILRAMNDHACKQLVGLIMDYVIMNWETIEQLQALIDADAALGDRIPPVIESAISLLRFEKVGRWESRAWEWEVPPVYDSDARRVAEGKSDRRKQDALYVRIGSDGRVCPPPEVAPEEISSERERLSSFGRLVQGMFAGEERSYRYEKAMAVIKAMFEQAL